MALKRYTRSPILSAGTRYGTSVAIVRIRDAVASGAIPCREVILAAGQRLDTVAGSAYGDGSLWWVIAAASDIGWAPQVPPGTVLLVPVSLSAVERAIST